MTTTWPTPTQRGLAQIRPALADHGISETAAEPLRLAVSSVWRIHGTGMVWKVSPAHFADRQRAAVRCAQWLAEQDIPAVQAAPEGPIYLLDDAVITMWRDLGEHREASAGEIANLLISLHETKPPWWLPRRAGLERSLARLDQITWADENDLHAIRTMAGVEERYSTRIFEEADDVALHGDAWPGNFVHCADGVTRMIDLERMARGNRLYDLTTIAVKATVIGQYPAQLHHRAARAYGIDVTREPTWPHLRITEMIKAVCYAVAVGEHNVAARDFAQHRIDCLLGRHGGGPYTWPALPVLPGAVQEA